MPAQKAKLTAYSPVRHLKGVGPQLEKRLAKLNIFTLQDLIFHFPHRYQNRTQPTPLHSLLINEEQLTTGVVSAVRTHTHKQGRTITTITIQDGAHTLSILLFNAPRQQLQRYTTGTHLLCFGTTKLFDQQLKMTHPDIELSQNGAFDLPQQLTPIYPTTQGLHQKIIQKLIRALLSLYESGECEFDLLPKALYQQFDMHPLLECLNNIHFPPANKEISHFRQQVALEELLTHYLNIFELRKKREQALAPPFDPNATLHKQLINRLPFQLTDGQAKALDEICNDLFSATVPMFRLVQGDVGCGKTIIAALTALLALESGYQVALLAPTEILAHQHFETFNDWFKPFKEISVHLLLGKTPKKTRKALIENLASDTQQIVIGTHALYQHDIPFNKLGLVIIDEQHRFGVEQRQALLQKCKTTGFTPHQLILTATPIPRTLAMTLFDCMDCSTIETLPTSRKTISTAVLPNTRRDQLIDRIQQACDQEQQVFWVCPNIEAHPNSDHPHASAHKAHEAGKEEKPRASVEEIHTHLSEKILHHNITVVHGKMSSEEKQQAMEQFQSGASSILVATTVIEVGVNIPKASIMVIENAELFGLAQLHQLRGRVGRGSKESYCLLLYTPPLSTIGHERLETIRNSHNGFDIAEQDLNLRGSGELLGTEQAGITRFKIANIHQDRQLLRSAKEVAHWLLKQGVDSLHYKLSQRWLHSPVNDQLS